MYVELKDKNLFVIGIYDDNGNLLDFVKSGRPSTIRVCKGMKQCENAMKQKYHVNMKPIRLCAGDVNE